MRKPYASMLLWILSPGTTAAPRDEGNAFRKFTAEHFPLDARPEVQLDVRPELLHPLTSLLEDTYPNVSQALFDLRSDPLAHQLLLNRTMFSIEQAIAALRLESLAETQYSSRALSHRVIWPDIVLRALDRVGLLHLERHRASLRAPVRRNGDMHLMGQVQQQASIVRHSARDSEEHSFALQHASQALMSLRQMCAGVELLKNLATLRGGDLLRAMSRMEDLSREQFAIGSQYCDTHLSAQVFRILLAFRHFDPSQPLHHCPRRSCWGAHDTTLRLAGQHEAAEEFFETYLKPHVAWRFAAQMPTEFNSLFATPKPQPFLDVAQFRVAQRIIAAREAITAEFLRYEQEVVLGRTHSMFDPDHIDSYPIEGADALGYKSGAWEYLTLKQDGFWDMALCDRYFLVTCGLVRDLREVTGQFLPERDRCEGYCEQPFGSGFTSFYRLAPGVSVPLHSGLTNTRIKCQLVIRAPDKGQHGASITVGGITKQLSAGDVYCFDDSYVHSTHNGGGINADVFRVVFDVSFLHPGLWDSDLRILAVANDTLAEVRGPRPTVPRGLDGPSGGTGEAFGRW